MARLGRLPQSIGFVPGCFKRVFYDYQGEGFAEVEDAGAGYG